MSGGASVLDTDYSGIDPWNIKGKDSEREGLSVICEWHNRAVSSSQNSS